MKEEISQWRMFIDFINIYNNGDIIYRKNIGDTLSRINSMDNFRRILTKLGYLKWSSVGEYTKVMSIPTDLTSIQAYEASRSDATVKAYFRARKINKIFAD